MRHPQSALSICFWLILTLASNGLSRAQTAGGPTAFEELGRPYLTRYTSSDYRAYPQNFQVGQDANGFLYVGNIEGLLRFDARDWTLASLPKGDLVRSLRVVGDRVYVGSYDEFGFFEITPLGLGDYHDLSQLVPESMRSFGDIWDVNALADDVYFMSARYLFRYNGGEALKVWQTATEFHTSFAVNGELLVREEGAGLKRVAGEQLQWVTGGEQFADMRIYEILPLADRQLLLSTRASGLLRFDSRTGELSELAAQYRDRLTELQPYRGAVLFDGSLAILTLTGHAILMSPSGQLQRIMKLSDYRLSSAFVDREAGLWIDSGPDLLRIEIPSALSTFGPEQGLTGFVQDIERHAGTLYVATSMGVFTLEPAATPFQQARFQRLPWFDEEVWDLVSMGDRLLVASSSGVSELMDNTQAPQLVASGFNVRRLLPSAFHSQRLYLAAEEGLLIAERDNGEWHSRTVENVAWRLNSVVEEGPGKLWVGSFGSGVIELTLDEQGDVRSFRPLGPDFGLPQGTGNELEVVGLADDIYVLSDAGIHQLDRDDDQSPRFTKDTQLAIEGLDAATHGILLHEGPDLRVWSLSERLGVSHRVGAGYRWQPLTHKQSPGEVAYALLAEENGALWIGSSNRLVRYDTEFKAPTMPPYQTWLSSVASQRGAIAEGQTVEREDLPITVKAEMPGFRHGIIPRIQYRLNDQPWSAWQEDFQFRVDALSPGPYRMQVRAAAVAGVAQPATINFKVDAPWYLQWWGITCLALGTLLLLWFLLARYASWRSQRLVKRNEALERAVSEATSALEQRSAELELANAQLRDLANIDGLTGVGNRRKLDHHLDQCWQRAAEMEFPLSLVMVDIDNFKRFNDEFGHLRGDECLRTVAHELSRLSAREDDLVARYGGEEFILVLFDMPLAAARSLAESFRKRIERRFATSMGTSGFTVSAGVATVYPSSENRPVEMLAQVDDALYQAKARGRNQVVALDLDVRQGKA